jgi:hypothetical protein
VKSCDPFVVHAIFGFSFPQRILPSRSGVRSLHLAEEPRARKTPTPLGCGERDTQLFCCLLLSEADKETKFHYLGGRGVHRGQTIQRLIQREEIVVGHGQGQFQRIEFHALKLSAVFQPLLSPRGLDQNPAHGFCGRAEEVRAILKADLLVWLEQAQPSFVNESGGLQRVAGSFVGHLVGGQPAQFFVYGDEQLFATGGVAVFYCAEKLRHLAHVAMLKQWRVMSNYAGRVSFHGPAMASELNDSATRCRSNSEVCVAMQG